MLVAFLVRCFMLLWWGESELDLQSELEYSEDLSCSDSEFEQLEMGELRVWTHFLLCFFRFLCLVLVAVLVGAFEFFVAAGPS